MDITVQDIIDLYNQKIEEKHESFPGIDVRIHKEPAEHCQCWWFTKRDKHICLIPGNDVGFTASVFMHTEDEKLLPVLFTAAVLKTVLLCVDHSHFDNVDFLNQVLSVCRQYLEPKVGGWWPDDAEMCMPSFLEFEWYEFQDSLNELIIFVVESVSCTFAEYGFFMQHTKEDLEAYFTES